MIVGVRPRTTTGRYPAKAVIGHPTTVSADIFRDGHDILAARVRWRPKGESKWRPAPMAEVNNDLWTGTIEPTDLGLHQFVVEAWTDRFATWAHDVTVKHAAGQDVELELEEGALILQSRRPQLHSKRPSPRRPGHRRPTRRRGPTS